MRATRSLVPAALAVALMPACSTTTSHVTGFAPAAPGSSPGPAARTLWIDLDASLRAGLRATDAWAPGHAAPAFRFEIEFQPKALGYSFDASQIVLRDALGFESRPVGATNGYCPLVNGTRISVQFDHPVTEGEQLELVVAGAAVGARRLEPVTVALSRFESRTQKPSPGLVGVGKVAGKVVGGILSLIVMGAGGGI